MTEKAVAIKILKRVIAQRDDSDKMMDESTLAEYVAGYEVALQELIDWLAEEYIPSPENQSALPPTLGPDRAEYCPNCRTKTVKQSASRRGKSHQKASPVVASTAAWCKCRGKKRTNSGPFRKSSGKHSI